MKRVKLVLGLMVAVVMTLSLCSPVAFGADSKTANSCAEIAMGEKTIHDKSVFSKNQLTDYATTTTLSQENYIQEWNKTKDMIPESATQTVCELFISSIFACQHNSSYSFWPFTLSEGKPGKPNDNTLAYYESKCEYERCIAEICNRKTVSDHIQFDNYSAKISGKDCLAEIGTHYTFNLKGDFNGTFYQNCIYYLELKQSNGLWRVVSIRSSLPEETDADFEYRPFDAYATAKLVTTPVFEECENGNSLAQIEKASNEVEAFVPYANTSYIVSSAVNYAAQHYNSINSAFGCCYNQNGAEANCQNFASQCVWRGLLYGCGTDGSSIQAIPAVSTSLAGSSANNVWCHNQATTYYSVVDLNWAWDNVNGFLKLILESNHTKAGPQGTFYYGLSHASAGDVITWDLSGDRNLNNATFNHAMFVTQVTGTEGNRTPANICIAANSSASTSAYEPLTSYCSLSGNYFANAHITGGYYRVKTNNPPVQ